MAAQSLASFHVQCAIALRRAPFQCQFPFAESTCERGPWRLVHWRRPEDRFNNAVPLKEGSYILHSANRVHWDGAGAEEVVVQIIGLGPVRTTPFGAPAPQDGDLAEAKYASPE